MNIPSGRLIAASLTGKNCAELGRHIEGLALANHLPLRIKRSPSPGAIEGLRESECTLLNSERASGHSVGAEVAIVDEIGLFAENKRGLIDAFISSLSTSKHGRLLAISVRGNSPLLTEMLERRKLRHVAIHEYFTPMDRELTDESSWKLSNPGLGTIKDVTYMRKQVAGVRY